MKTLKNCRIIDIHTGSIKESDIHIEDGAIASTDKTTEPHSEIHDLHGAYILPGLINCHAHLSIVFPFRDTNEQESAAITALRCFRRGQDALSSGITTVRTVSELHRADLSLRKMIQDGWVQGPRIFSAGSGVSISGGHGAGFGAQIADGVEEFLKKSRKELRAGADFLKIFITGGIAHRTEGYEEPQMTPKEIQAVVTAARSANTYVCAHAGSSGPIIEALKAGVTSFEHGYNVDRDTARTMCEAGAFLVPTLCVTRSREWMRTHKFEEWTIDKALEAGPDHMQSIRTAIKEGVTIAVGTDIPPGDEDGGVNITAREIGYLIQAGMTPLQALQAATLTAAKLVGGEKTIGAVEAGYQADIIAMRANPLSDISALHNILLVMKNGCIIRKDTE